MAKYLDSDGVLYLWNKIKSAFVKKESGKGLSTNDFTTALMNKLNGIASGANNYVHPSYTSRASGLYKIVVDATGHISQVAAVTKADITALGIPAQDTTYANMTGATASVAGKAGLVTAPAAGKQNAFLCGDGSWAVPTNTTYEVVNENSNGLMTPAMLSKLESINEVYSMATNAKELANEAYNTIGTLETNIEATYAKKADVVGMYKYKGSVTNSSNLPTNNQTKGDVYNIVNASSYGPAGTNVAWDGSAWDALGGLFEIESITNAEIDAICV